MHIPPFESWQTAATNIQDAVDLAIAGDVVLVSNGIYRVGGRSAPDGLFTRVVITNAITLY